MPNGIEAPKIVLTRQAEIPKLALAGSPAAALGEGLSGILASLALSVPDVPGPPLPAAAGGGLPQVPDFLRSIQASLPGGGPPLLGGGGSPATIGPKTETKAPAVRAFKIGV